MARPKWVPADPTIRTNLLEISEDQWVIACEVFWEISPMERPSIPLREDVRRRLRGIKAPNRHNAGQIPGIPLDFIRVAVKHLSDAGIRDSEDVPDNPLSWVQFLDSVTANLGTEYAKICRAVIPDDVVWEPPAMHNAEASTLEVDYQAPDDSTPESGGQMTKPSEPASTEIESLLGNLRDYRTTLLDFLRTVEQDVEAAQQVDIRIADLIGNWNSSLKDLAVALHGEEIYLVGFEALQTAVDRIREEETSEATFEAGLKETRALLQQYRTQRTSELYEKDANYRMMVDSRILELEASLDDLGPNGPVISPDDGIEKTEATLKPVPGRPDPNDGNRTGYQEDAKPEDPRDADKVHEEAARLESASAPSGHQPPGGDHDDPSHGNCFGNEKSEAIDAVPDDCDSAESYESIEPELLRGLAELITRNQWAAASAISAAIGMDEETTQALEFCSESFCLPIISSDPREMLGRSVGAIAQGLQTRGSAAVLTAVGLLRACLAVGREQSWLLTDESLDCLQGEWRAVARELRDAVAEGYLHFGGQNTSLSSGLTPGMLKSQAEVLKEELPQRGYSGYAPASQVMRRLMSSSGELFNALEGVSQWADGTLHVDALRDRRAALEDPRRLIDRVDNEANAGKSRPKKAPIDYEAFDSLSARIRQVADLLDQAIILASQQSAAAPQKGALAEKVRRLIDGIPEVDLDGSLAAAALGRFRAWLLDGSGPVAEMKLPFSQLKFTTSLSATSAARDRTMNLPIRSDASAQAIVAELLDPGLEFEQFEAYLANGNLAAALAVGGDDDNALLLRQSEREWAARINKRELNLRAELLRLQAHTQLDQVDRARFDGLISSLTASPTNRFDLIEFRAEEIENEFRSRWISAGDQLKLNLRERAVTAGISSDAEERIMALIDANDLITAREFLSHLSNNPRAELPPAHGGGPVTLQEFRALIEEWPVGDQRANDVVEDALGDRVPEKVAAALRAWNQAARLRKTSEWEKLLPNILSLIGLEKIPDQPIADKTERNQIRFGRFTVKALPVGGSYVAALGSKARMRGYSVYALVPDVKIESILDQIPIGERREANLILYPGLLSWEARRALRAATDNRKITTLVIDSAVIAYMALQQERYFKTLQRITLPFSIFPHWAPRVAGDVPDELFVGRTEIIDKIMSPEGSIFVYGGRQLGKSALLHRIERDFNRLDKKVAIYIDFKVERIGEENEPEYLWTVLRNRLHEAKVLPSTSTATKAESVEKGIREWLAADPERSILLLCDETDAFLQSEAQERLVNQRQIRSFPNVAVLKGLMDKTQRRFKPVFAGLHQVQRIADIPNSPLAHGGEDILVGPLDSAEAWELVVRPFSALGYEFESLDLVWRLLAFTNHQPGLVQIVCDELYKRMRESQDLIPPGQPPYIIAAADVDSVITSREVREFIAERFRLTIQLEDRYFVIAMIVALFSLESGFSNDFDRSLILEFCRAAWPRGFNSLTEKEISVYLDEMVGLNVLIHGSTPTRYGLRSPNVVHILGDSEMIEKQLTEGRFELPLQYNARVSRRRLSDSRERETYSPLTEYQLSLVMPKRNGARERYAVAVVGSTALGIGKTRALLEAASREDYDYPLELVSADYAADLVKIRSGVIARRPLVVCDCVDRPECLDEVISRITKASRDGNGRRAVLLGAFGAASIPELVVAGVEVVTLQLWTSETVRGIIDNPISDPDHRDEFILATGGWPSLCEMFLDQIRGEAVAADVIARARSFPEDQECSRRFLREVGLTDGHDLAVLGSWAGWAGPREVLSMADIGEVIETGSDEQNLLLDRLSNLSVISERNDGYLLNDVVRRSLIVIGAADAD